MTVCSFIQFMCQTISWLGSETSWKRLPGKAAFTYYHLDCNYVLENPLMSASKLQFLVVDIGKFTHLPHGELSTNH